MSAQPIKFDADKWNPNQTKDLVLEGVYKDLPDRALRKTTLERFGVKVCENGDVVYPYFDENNTLVAQKIRTPEKAFRCTGMSKNLRLFGANLFPSGKRLTITEGEGDALALYQMMGNWPVVSLPNGAQSVRRSIQDNYEYLQGFQEIILCFDADEPGQIAAKEAAELLPFTRVRVVKLTQYKDANDYLKAGATEAFKKEWWEAPEKVPQGVVSGLEVIDRAIKKRNEKVESTPYPWKGFNDYLFGIRPRELVVIGAGSGTGKSSLVRELVYHLLRETKDNLGLMFLEESVERTADALCGLHLNKPIHLPDTVVSQSDLKRGYDETSGLLDSEENPRLYYYDHFGSSDIDTIINQITYFAKARNCRYIILDHISMVVSDQRNQDERQAIDALMTRLRSTIEALNITVFAIVHLSRTKDKGGHEEGAQVHASDFRGSHSIIQLADVVIAGERNKQDEDENKRHITRYRILKNRFAGLEGVCSYLKFDRSTFRMKEMSEAEHKALFGEGGLDKTNAARKDVANVKEFLKQFEQG